MADIELSSSSDSECETDSHPGPMFGFLTLGSSAKKHEDVPSNSKDSQKRLASSLQPGLDVSNTYLNIYPHRQPGDTTAKLKQLSLASRIKQSESKSIVAQPGFEKQYTVPPYLEGKKKIRRERLKERDKTKGTAWFNMPATEVTEEIKNDLAVLQMRNSLNPKQFYKRGSDKIRPKYFRVGTVVEPPIDFYHARIPKKQRKRTLVEELLDDFEFRKYQKRKYAEAIRSLPQKFQHSSVKKMKRKGMKLKKTKREKKAT